MPGLLTLVSRMFIGGLRHYRACFLSTLPALLALVIPLQLGVLVLSQGATSPLERLLASLFALQLTVLGLVTSYALLPRAVATLRARPLRPVPLPKQSVRRAVLAFSLLLLAISLGISLRPGPTAYSLPALAVMTLFWAAWPWLKGQATVGEHLFKEATRRWWQSRPTEKLTVLIALTLGQAGIILLGRAVVVAAGAVGGPTAGWTSQVLLAAGLLPLHLLILAILGSDLLSDRHRARLPSGLKPALRKGSAARLR